MSADAKAKPPFGPPDCPWRPLSANNTVPENAVYQNGTLDGDKVYIGRVYDQGCVFVGTAIPNKGICIYIDKKLDLKSSADYEVLTVDCGDPLCFQDMELDNRNIFVAGVDETGEILYAGCVVDGNNTYYGWVSKTTRSIYIPRDSSVGPQVVDKNFGVLIHKFLDRLCICPPCPFPPHTA